MVNIDLILKEACRRAELNIAEQDSIRLSEMPDIETSKDFDRRVDKIIRRMKTGKYKKTRKVLRVFILVAILIVTFSITATGVDPLHERIRNFLIETFSDGSTIEFKDNSMTRGTLYSEYTYIPEGYELVKHVQDPRFEKFVFEDSQGNQLFLSSRPNDESFSMLDTEEVGVEEIIINILPGLYYYKDDFTQVTWSEGKYNYSVHQYSLTEQLSKEELIKIAESRKNVY